MSQPTWTDRSVSFDVLAVFAFLQTSGPAVSVWHRFSLRSGVFQGWAADWTLKTVAIPMQGHYPGNITNITPLRNSIGSERQPKVVFPEVGITIARDYGRSEFTDFLDDLEDKEYGAATGWEVWCSLWLIGRGTSPVQTTDLYFAGMVDPSGVEWKNNEITIHPIAEMQSDKMRFPNEFFSVADYPDLDPDLEGRPIPIVFCKDWPILNNPPGGEDSGMIEVPCVMTDNIGLDNFSFKLCDPGPNGILGPYPFDSPTAKSTIWHMRDGAHLDDYQITNIDSANATFDGYNSHWGDGGGGTLWERGDKFFFGDFPPEGTQDGLGQTITNPAEIWLYLLFYFADVPAGDVDITTYSTALSVFNSYAIKGQRWMREQKSLADWLQELSVELGLYTYMHRGKYCIGISPRYYTEIFSADYDIYPKDIRANSSKRKGGFNEEIIKRLHYFWDYHDIPYYIDDVDKKPVYENDGNYFHELNQEGALTKDFHIQENLWIYDQTTADLLSANIYSILSEYGDTHEFKSRRLMDAHVGQVVTTHSNNPIFPTGDSTIKGQIYEHSVDFMTGDAAVKIRQVG